MTAKYEKTGDYIESMNSVFDLDMKLPCPWMLIASAWFNSFLLLNSPGCFDVHSLAYKECYIINFLNLKIHNIEIVIGLLFLAYSLWEIFCRLLSSTCVTRKYVSEKKAGEAAYQMNFQETKAGTSVRRNSPLGEEGLPKP